MNRTTTPNCPFIRGQATIEMMVILPLLLIILAVSISIFGQQLLIADSLRAQNAVVRSAELVADSVMEISLAHSGSSMRVHIPKGPELQTISFSNGLIEVYSQNGYASAKITNTNWSSPTFFDANTIILSRDVNGFVRASVVP